MYLTRLTYAAWVGLTLTLSIPLSAQETRPPLAIVGATLIDGRSPAPISNATVIVIDGVIDRITADSTPAPAGVVTIDARGRYLLPGLIDAHSHLNTLEAAQRALESGVTTIRTAGVGGYRDVAIRNMVRDRKLPGPEILATGVYVTPDIGDAVLADPRLAGMGGGVRSLKDLAQLVTVNVDHDVNWIKTRGTERAGRPETDPREQVYNLAQLQAIVATAREANVWVMAHAHGDTGIRDAVLAGVRSIEHGTYASDATLQLMKERRTYLVPTLSSISSFGLAGDYADPALFLRGLHMAPRRRESVAKAYAMGIPIVTGVDTSYESDSFARVAREVGFLVEEGVSPFDAIRGATSLAAEMLGVDDRTGSIQVGMEGDFILIERNPLDDIRSIQDLLVVVSNGYIVLNRLSTIDRVPAIPK